MTCPVEAVVAPGHDYGGYFTIVTFIDLRSYQIVLSISLCTGINGCTEDSVPAFGVLFYDTLQVRFWTLNRVLPYIHDYL